MITEERLKELIEQKATIYSTDYHEEIQADEFEIDNKWGKFIKIKKCGCHISFTSLFEALEQAEFDMKYCHNEKVVKMPIPPTYEEFLEKGFSENFIQYLIKQNSRGNYIVLTEMINWKDIQVLKLLNTKENYYKALDKMVELFKGEE